MRNGNLSSELLAAYRATKFCARVGGDEIVLLIGQKNPELEKLMLFHGVEAGCFVTAWNPNGQALDDEANSEANERLRKELDECGWTYFEGEGRGSDSAWPAEASFLVLGPSFYEAAALCLGFDQIAVVDFDSKAVPHLLIGRRVASSDSNFRGARMLVPKLGRQVLPAGTWSIEWPDGAKPVTAKTSLALVGAFAEELRSRVARD